jgi:glutamate-1-semialdehyde 2,1-aminomutase
MVMPLSQSPPAAGADPFTFTTSAELLARSQGSLSMGVSSGMRRTGGPAPLFFERGEGPYYFDADGHRLLDYTLAWGPLILGNAHPAVIAAVTDQLFRGFAFGAQHRGEIELAELMVSVLPGVERIARSMALPQASPD